MTPVVFLASVPAVLDPPGIEPGPFEAAGALERAGMAVVARDLNVELLYESLHRRSTLWRMARLVSDGDNDVRISRSFGEWADRFARTARHLGFGPDQPAIHHDPEPSGSLVDLFESDPAVRHRMKTAHIRRFLTPRTSSVDAALEFASLANPALAWFYDEVMSAMEVPPILVGVHVSRTQQVPSALRFVVRVRDRWPGARVVAWGPWWNAAESLLPGMPELVEAVDGIAVGDPLVALPELARRAAAGEAFTGAPDTVVAAGGRVHLPEVRHAPAAAGRPSARYEGARLDLYPERRFSIPVLPGDVDAWAAWAVEEMRVLHERHGIPFFRIGSAPVPWGTLATLARRLAEGPRVLWTASVDVSLEPNDDDARRLHEAGCEGLDLALPTTDEARLRVIAPDATVEAADACLATFRRAGLGTRVRFTALPGATGDDLRRDLAWAEERADRIDRATMTRFRLVRGAAAVATAASLGLAPRAGTDRDLEVQDVPFDGPQPPSADVVRAVAADLEARFPGNRARLGRIARPFRLGLVSMAEPDLFDRTALGSRCLEAALLTLNAGGFPAVEITHFDELDHSSDTPRQIAAALQRAELDAVAFGLFVWNHHVAAEVARLLARDAHAPRLIAGGPWVPREAEAFARDNPQYDVVIHGDAEAAFTHVVARLALGREPLDCRGIPGVTVRDGAGLISTARVALDPNSVPSPYRAGLIEPREGVRLTVRRGCNKRCAYCNWGFSSSLPLCQDFLRSEIRWAVEHEVHNCWFVDSTLNQRVEDLRAIVDAIESARAPEDFSTDMFLDTVHVDDAHLELLRRCHLHTAEVGLQTINPRALKATRRSFDRAQFEAGVRRLSTVANVCVDVILGLPGDDPEGFRQTLDYVIDLGVEVQLFHLLALPGSEIAKEPDKFGLVFNAPGVPWMRRSATLSERDIAECASWFVRDVRRKSHGADYCTRNPRFARYEYNYLVPEEAYRIGTERFGDPPPLPRVSPGSRPPSGTTARPDPGPSRVALELQGLIGPALREGRFEIAGCRLELETVRGDSVVLAAHRAAGGSGRIFLRSRTDDQPAFARTARYDLWYDAGHSLPHDDLIRVLTSLVARLKALEANVA